MSELGGALKEEADPPPPYIIFVVVFLFFVTGLCGFLVCHLLKLKGYRCTMEEDEDDEEELEEEQDEDDGENEDTVEKILKCIIENEANMEAFNEMVGKGNICVRHDPRLRKESVGGLPPHMHTVHSGTDLHDTCHLCAQIRNKRASRRPSRTPRFRRPGEQTVFSVGRFRVTHTDKKSSDGGGRIPDVLVGSGDNLDQSQDSEERRDGGYNLRSLFKDSRPPSESTGKRRRSLTIFGLRRGSDPIGVKVVGGGREGVRFIPQPVVIEEPLNENGENGSKVVSKLRGESLRIPSTVEAQAKNLIVSEGSTQEIQLQTKDAPALVTSPPNSLPISLGSSPKAPPQADEQTNQSPGPLQTSTPLSPLPDHTEEIIPFLQGLPGSETPPDPCTSPVLEQDSFASPTLISLGSSPHLTSKTPTSPATPSSKFSVQVFSQPASSPKLLFSRPSESPVRSLDKSMSSQQTSPSVSLQDDALALEMSSKEPGLKSTTDREVSTTQTSTEKPELKNLGILEGDEGFSQLSSSSPLEGRVRSVTIVEASQDQVSLLPASSPKLLPRSPVRPLDKSMQTSPSVSLQDDALALEMTSKEPGLKSTTDLEVSTIQTSMEKPELKNLGILEGDKGFSQLPSSSQLDGKGRTIVEARPDQVSLQPASSPKLLPRSPVKPLDKSMQTSPSVSLQDDALALEMTSKEPGLKSTTDLEVSTTRTSTEKHKLKNLGILEGDEGSSQLSSSSQHSSSPKLLPRSLDKNMTSLQTSPRDDALALEMTSKESSFKGLTKLEGSTTQMSMEKPESKNLGILDGSFPQLPSSSPLGGRVSSVTIIKASPDSKMEFSVATMVEERAGTSKVSEQGPQGDGEAEVTWTLGDDKEDMVEMEEIAECRVTQPGDGEKA